MFQEGWKEMNIVILDPQEKKKKKKRVMKSVPIFLYFFLFLLFHFKCFFDVDHFVKSLVDLLQRCSHFMSHFLLATRPVGSEVPDQGWYLRW